MCWQTKLGKNNHVVLGGFEGHLGAPGKQTGCWLRTHDWAGLLFSWHSKVALAPTRQHLTK